MTVAARLGMSLGRYLRVVPWTEHLKWLAFIRIEKGEVDPQTEREERIARFEELKRQRRERFGDAIAPVTTSPPEGGDEIGDRDGDGDGSEE